MNHKLAPQEGRSRKTTDYGMEDNWAEALEHSAKTTVTEQIKWKCRRCGKADWVSVPGTKQPKNSILNTPPPEYRKVELVLSKNRDISRKLTRSRHVAQRYCTVIEEQRKEIEELKKALTIKPEMVFQDDDVSDVSSYDEITYISAVPPPQTRTQKAVVKVKGSFKKLLRMMSPTPKVETERELTLSEQIDKENAEKLTAIMAEYSSTQSYIDGVNLVVAFLMNLSTCQSGADVIMTISAELLRYSSRLIGSFRNVSVQFNTYLTADGSKVKPEGPFTGLLEFMRTREGFVGDEKSPIVQFAMDAVAAITFFTMSSVSEVSEDYLTNWLRCYRNKNAANVFECAYNATFQFFDFMDTWFDHGIALTLKRFTSCGTIAQDLSDLESKFSAFACRDESQLGVSIEYYVDSVSVMVRQARDATRSANIRPAAKMKMEVMYDRAKKLESRVTQNYALEIARTQPFGWGVYSAPRAGKTQICTLFNRAVGVMGNFPTKEVNVYQSNPDDEYDSGYTNLVNVYVKDDVGNKKTVSGQQPEMAEMISVVNNVPLLSIQAELDKKGLISKRPKVATLTSNFPHFAIHEATNKISSYAQRFILLEMRVKPEFERIQGEGALNSKKASECSPYDMHEFAVYTLKGKDNSKECSVVSDPRYPGLSVVKNGRPTRWMNTLDTQRFLSEEARKHYENQTAYLKASKNIVEAACCKDCGALCEYTSCTETKCSYYECTVVPEFRLPTMDVVNAITNTAIFQFCDATLSLNEEYFTVLIGRLIGSFLTCGSKGLWLCLFYFLLIGYGMMHCVLHSAYSCAYFALVTEDCGFKCQLLRRLGLMNPDERWQLLLLTLSFNLAGFLILFQLLCDTFSWFRRILKVAIAQAIADKTSEGLSKIMYYGTAAGVAMASFNAFRNFRQVKAEGNILSPSKEDVIERAKEVTAWKSLPKQKEVQPKTSSPGAHTLNVIEKHTVFLHKKNSPTKASGQMIGRTELLVNTHVWNALVEEEEVVLAFKKNPDALIKCKWRGYAAHPECEDMTVVILAKSLPVGNDLMDRLAVNVRQLKHAEVLVQYPRDVPVAEYEWSTTLVSNNAFKNQKHCSGAVMLGGSNENGDCSALYVLKESPGAIVGFHCGGGRDRLLRRTAVAFGLTCSMVETMISLAVDDVANRENFSETVFKHQSPVATHLPVFQNKDTGIVTTYADETHKRSFANFVPVDSTPKSDAMTTYGHLDGARGKPRSRVTSTPLSECLTELGVPPKVFKPNFKADRAYSIAVQKSMSHTCAQIEPKLIAKAQEGYLLKVEDALSEIRDVNGCTQLTLHQALNGNALPELRTCRFISQMPMDTSAGSSYTGDKEDYVDVSYEEDGRKILTAKPQLEREFEVICTNAEMGIRPGVVCRGTLKDEPTSQAKIDLGKYRIFLIYDFDFNLALKSYAAPLANDLYAIPIHSGMLQGTNAMTDEWTQVHQGLVSYSDNITCGDYSGYDITLSGQVIRAAGEVLCTLAQRKGYSDKQVVALWTLICELADGVMVFNGTVLSTDSWWASGNWCTILIGGMCNNLLLMSAWYRLVGFNGPDFHLENRIGTVGDDNIIATRRPGFNMNYLSAFFAEHDMVFTDSNKQAVTRDFITPDEAELCKRKWVVNEYIAKNYGKTFYNAPIEIDSIYKPLHCMFKPAEPCMIPNNLASSLANAVRELARHEKSVFLEHRAIIAEAVDLSTLPYTLYSLPNCELSYEEWQEELLKACDLERCDSVVPECMFKRTFIQKRKVTYMPVVYDNDLGRPMYFPDCFRGGLHPSSREIIIPIHESCHVDDARKAIIFIFVINYNDENVRIRVELPFYCTFGDEAATYADLEIDAGLLIEPGEHGVQCTVRYVNSPWRGQIWTPQKFHFFSPYATEYFGPNVASVTPECIFRAMNHSAQPAAKLITPRKVLQWCFLVALMAVSFGSMMRLRRLDFSISNETDKEVGTSKQETMYIEKNSPDESAMTSSAGINIRSVLGEFTNDGFFSRPVKIQTFTWDVGLTLNVKFDPWSDFCEDPRIINRLAHFSLMRGDLHVDFLINGNAFYRGRVMASYVPLHTNDDNYSFDAGQKSTFITASQRPHVMLNPTNSSGGALHLPYVYPRDYMSIPGQSWNEMGEIVMGSLNNLEHDNGSTEPLTITVLAYMSNLELAMPTSVLPGTVTPQGPDEYGEISGPAHTIANWSGKLSGFPYIGPFARATEIGARAVGNIASIFGFSRPRVLERRNIFYGPELALTDTSDNIASLAMHAKKEVTISGEAVWDTGEDPMALLPIAMKKSYLTTFDWSPNDAPEDHLFSAAVRPMQTGVAEGQLHLTPSAWVCAPFSFWTGSMKFTFEIVCSAFHKGRLRFVWDPVVYKGSDHNVAYSAIIDITDAKEIELVIGWAQDLPYLRCVQAGEVTYEALRNYSSSERPDAPDVTANGIIGVYVLNSLTTPSEVMSPIAVNVFTQMCDDFEVACLTDRVISNLTPAFEQIEPEDTIVFTPPVRKEVDARCVLVTTPNPNISFGGAAMFAPRWDDRNDALGIGTGDSAFSFLMYGGPTGGNFTFSLVTTDSQNGDDKQNGFFRMTLRGITYDNLVPNTSTNRIQFDYPIRLEPGVNIVSMQIQYFNVDPNENTIASRYPIQRVIVPLPPQFEEVVLTDTALTDYVGGDATSGLVQYSAEDRPGVVNGAYSTGPAATPVFIPAPQDVAAGSHACISSQVPMRVNNKDYSGTRRVDEFGYFFSAPFADGITLDTPSITDQTPWSAQVRSLAYLRDTTAIAPECIFRTSCEDDSLDFVYSESSESYMYISDCSTVTPEAPPLIPNEGEKLSFSFGSTSPTGANQIHFGEIYASWRTILKRYVSKYRISVLEGDELDIVLPQYPQVNRAVRIGAASNPTVGIQTYTHPIDWISPAYLAMRGATRVWMTGHSFSNTNNTSQSRRASDVVTFHRVPAQEIVLDGAGNPTFTGLADKGKMTLAGGHFEYTQNTGCAGIEMPYYNRLRFHTSRNTRGINQGFQDREWIRAMVQARRNGLLNFSYATAEDFALNHFVCTPVMELAS